MPSIKNLGANKTELHMSNGDIIFFSYQTPVAAQVVSGFVRTETKYSVTTSKHISQWLDGANATTVPQSQIDDLVQ